jgi:type I restriction enzyme, R subunit
MSSLHREIHFESDIATHLESNGWLYSPDGKGYDRELALIPEDVIGWIKETQANEFNKLKALHNGSTEKMLLERLTKLIESDGVISVLRHGFKHMSSRFDMCQFKPSHGLNPETADRYAKVRVRVMRQVHYSASNENSIDLVLFVNGIPVSTIEVKTDFTQSIHDAIWQYKKDRLPKDAVTKKVEPLLTFKRGAIVHFAVSSDEVRMTTKLTGADTSFLPFNMGNDGGAGNPPNPKGYRTSYLWERVLQRDNWLAILGSFVHLRKEEVKDKKGGKRTKESIIFPRFHQWEVVTTLISAARSEGAGHTYLTQHSAGSGKSNSISWLSHQLSMLHDAKDNKIFDSVIVVTDRTVLDSQLQDSIYQFEHKHGVVACISRDHGSKSGQLATALMEKRPIIIVTLQTFPFVLEEIRNSTSMKNRNFAVIVDEAHSSMSGASARKLREVLTTTQVEDGDDFTAEDFMLAEMEARKMPKNVSFFAFTATPKAKTIEVFGRRPDMKSAPSADNKPAPFHVYSMQQAIDEGFILDVLRNYTPYKLAYKIAHNGKEYSDTQVDKSEGMKQIAKWVRLHPYNIAQKVAIIVEHFRASVAWRLDGQAKAMVVTASRKEAVRYKLALDAYIKEKQYQDVSALVAFSGDVIDPESGPDKFNESSMNPGLKGREMREAFDTEDFNVMLVANKFQTGFDQPKLVGMYVDKRVDGVAAVQTFSRLNRTFPGKDETFILDFVNDAEQIREAFEPFYRTTQLANVSDPNVIHDLQVKLDGQGIYQATEVDSFAKAYFDPKGSQKALQALIAPAVDRYRVRWDDAVKVDDKEAVSSLELFVKDIAAFVRVYDFLSQIMDYNDTELESRYVYFKCLAPWLRPEKRKDPIDLAALVLTHHKIRSQGKADIELGMDGQDHQLLPITQIGTGTARDEEKARLSELVKKLNDLFDGDLSEVDKVAYINHIAGKLMEREILVKQAAENSKSQFGLGDFKGILMDTVIAGLDNYKSMAAQVLGNDRKKQEFADMVLDVVYEGLKTRSAQAVSTTQS